MKASPLKLAAVCAPAVLLAGAFYWVAGSDSNPQNDPDTYVNQLILNNGYSEGYRRNHAKGICATGYFEPSGQAAGFSSADMLSGERSSVIARFSIPGGLSGADNEVGIHALGLQLSKGGEQWRMAMLSVPVFVANKPQDFLQLLQAQMPDPQTGKPRDGAVEAYFADHPESKNFRDFLGANPISGSFAASPYNSISSFKLSDAKGNTNYVRYSFTPETEFLPVPEGAGPDFLFEDIAKRLSTGELRWEMKLAIAEDSDPVLDATSNWQLGRPEVFSGTLVLDQVEPEVDGKCRDVNFDPTVTPSGIEPSADPMLAARSAAYSKSHRDRLAETAHAGDHS